MIAAYEKLNELFQDLRLQIEDLSSESAMYIILLFIYSNINKSKELQQGIEEIIDDKKPFWGFNEKDCDAPPKEYALGGQANSSGVSFLYTAADIKTAIMEMRPQIGQHFNVCKIETCKDIQIFDFTDMSSDLKVDEYVKSGDLYAQSARIA